MSEVPLYTVQDEELGAARQDRRRVRRVLQVHASHAPLQPRSQRSVYLTTIGLYITIYVYIYTPIAPDGIKSVNSEEFYKFTLLMRPYNHVLNDRYRTRVAHFNKYPIGAPVSCEQGTPAHGKPC